MKQIKFNNVKSREDIENVIVDALQYDTIVDDEAAAQAYFRECEREGDVISRDIVNTRVSIWNEEMEGEEEYTVRVYEHYTDPGSVDYVYSYIIQP